MLSIICKKLTYSVCFKGVRVGWGRTNLTREKWLDHSPLRRGHPGGDNFLFSVLHEILTHGRNISDDLNKRRSFLLWCLSLTVT
jgi:hypothetical protein